MNNSNNQGGNNLKADRFAKLSEKLSQIQTTTGPNESINNSKYLNIDHKINEVDNKLQEHIDSLDKKYNSLKDQISKLTKYYEEDKFYKEGSKNKQNEELKNFETKVKSMLLDERQVRKYFVTSINLIFCSSICKI